MVGVLKRTGVFEYMAIRADKRGDRRAPYRVMVLLVLVTAGASALLDNVGQLCSWGFRYTAGVRAASGPCRS